ncbi:histidine decarboxylase [Actinoplanes sp. CA-030573]|uniref:histidine decarboxylase n=1 Tax=Actinoplanes sp. CA-030573 TaxID=3239898 RepID=UPI003D8C5784
MHNDPITAEVMEISRQLDDAARISIGFPGASDIDYRPLTELLTKPINNIGDPYTGSDVPNNTLKQERQVVELLADLFRAPADDRWGYVTSGGTESNAAALTIARSLYPDAVCYYSDSAHYSLDKIRRQLALPAVRIRSTSRGEIDYDDLRTQLGLRRDRPAIVIATIGTTMTEAVDDVGRITAILDDLAIRDRFVHADAALAGIPLALLDPTDRPGIDFADGADSMCISGHKFLAAPSPCSVVITKASHRARAAQPVGYIGSLDTTIGGSRSGHAPLILWYALNTLRIDGLRARAERTRGLAGHVCDQLRHLGWEAYRQPNAFTVVLRTPPDAVRSRWAMASHRGWSHVIPMPGTPIASINDFLEDMASAIRAGDGQQLALAGSTR